MADNTVGKINFQVGIDTSKVAAGIAQAKTEAERAANTGGAEIDNPVKSASMGVKNLLQQFAAIGAAAGVFYGLGRAIREGFLAAITTATEKAEELRTTLDLTKPKEAMAALEKQVDSINARYAAASGSVAGFIANLATGDTPGRLKRQAEELSEDVRRLRARDNALAEREREEAIKREADKENSEAMKARSERLNNLARMEREAFEESLTEREQIEYNYNQKIDETTRLQSEATNQFELDQATKTLAAINAARFKALSDYDRKVQESASKQTESLTKAFSSAVSSIQKSNAELLPVKDIIFSIEQVREGIAALGRQSQGMGSGFEGGDF